MKIIVPTENGKLCGHFGHCESFSFAEVDENAKKIISITTKIPEGGTGCHSINWLASMGAEVVLAGGMGPRPMMELMQNGVKVVLGCPELPVKEMVEQFLQGILVAGENTCSGGDHAHCHGGAGHCHHE